MTRPLDPDQLGRKGEGRFYDLCVDGRLVVNASTWDRKGWDFVVDFLLGRNAVAYAAKTDLSAKIDGGDVVWTADRFDFRDAAWLARDDAAYRTFIADTGRRTGIRSVVARALEDDGPSRGQR